MLLSSTKALLNHVGAEFLLRESSNLPIKRKAERVGEAFLLKVDDVLKDIIAEGILHKLEGAIGDLVNEPSLLNARCMVNASLQDTTTMAMSSNHNTVGANCVEDELLKISLRSGWLTAGAIYLSVLRRETIKTFLNYMVTVEILDQLHHSVLQGVDYGLDLLASGDKFNHLLQSAGAMGVERNVHHFRSGIIDQHRALLVGGELK